MLKQSVKHNLGSIFSITILVSTGLLILLPSSPLIEPVEALSIWTQTSDSDFIHGTFNNVKIVGSGPGAELKLDITEGHTGWVQQFIDPHPSMRTNHKMAMINGTDNIVLFGGIPDLDDTWIYELKNNTWTKKNFSGAPGSLPYGRYSHGMASNLNDDEVLIFCGEGPILGCYNDQWTYDFSDNKWTEINLISWPYNLYSNILVSIFDTDKVLLYGGNKGSGGYFNETWLYDFSNNTWTDTSPTQNPGPRDHNAMATIYDTDKILLFGGFNGTSFFNDTWIYNHKDNTWIQKSTKNSPSARYHHAMAPICGTDKVMLMGGYDGNNYLDDTWIYDLSDNTWVRFLSSEKPPARAGHAMAPISDIDKIILFGGNDDTDDFGDTWIFKYLYPKIKGAYISLPYDTETKSTFIDISWDAEIPIDTSIRFQLRTSKNESDLISKIFVGPDGSNATYYENSDSKIWSGHTGEQWIQYKVYFQNNNEFEVASLKDITISYNCWPVTNLTSPANECIISTNKPIFNWSFFDDSTLQVAFQVLIDDNIDFEDIDFDSGQQSISSQSWAFPSKTNYKAIQDGTWYWKARTKDSDGDWGVYGAPFQFTVDTLAPSSKIKLPLNDECYNYIDMISGDANDLLGGSGIRSVEIALERLSDNYYWNELDWVVDETWVNTIGTTNWSFDPISVSWDSGTSYSISSRAIDLAGNIEVPGGEVIFSYDNDDPESIIDYPKNKLWLNKLDNISGSINDPGGFGIDNVKICIKCKTNDHYWSGTGWEQSILWLVTNITIPGSWTYNTSRVSWITGYEYTITSRAYDFAGNMEFPGNRSNFKFDSEPPTANFIQINYGDEFTNSTKVTLTLDAADICSGVYQMSFSDDYLSWSNWVDFRSTISYNLPLGDGEKSVYFKVIDLAGNMAKAKNDTIILDMSPPNNLEIKINNGALLTNSTRVFLELYAEDAHLGVYQMAFRTNSTPWTIWEPFKFEKTFILPPNDGEKIVFFKVRDRLGNEAPPVMATIYLDTSPEPTEDNSEDDPGVSGKNWVYPIIWIFIVILVIIILMLLWLKVSGKRRSKKKTPEVQTTTTKPRILEKSTVQPKLSQPPPPQLKSESQQKPTIESPVVSKLEQPVDQSPQVIAKSEQENKANVSKNDPLL